MPFPKIGGCLLLALVLSPTTCTWLEGGRMDDVIILLAASFGLRGWVKRGVVEHYGFERLKSRKTALARLTAQPFLVAIGVGPWTGFVDYWI